MKWEWPERQPQQRQPPPPNNNESNHHESDSEALDSHRESDRPDDNITEERPPPTPPTNVTHPANTNNSNDNGPLTEFLQVGPYVTRTAKNQAETEINSPKRQDRDRSRLPVKTPPLKDNNPRFNQSAANNSMFEPVALPEEIHMSQINEDNDFHRAFYVWPIDDTVEEGVVEHLLQGMVPSPFNLKRFYHRRSNTVLARLEFECTDQRETNIAAFREKRRVISGTDALTSARRATDLIRFRPPKSSSTPKKNSK